MRDEKDWQSWTLIGILVLILGFVMLSISGCSALSPAPAVQEKSTDKFYRRDMEIFVDGVRYPGYGVLPVKDNYKFEARTKHDMDRFAATTCHRQIVEEKVDGSNWLKKSAKYKFDFARFGSVEKSDPCPLELVASADSNDHSWAFFEFQSPAYKLKAKVECDGWSADFIGVSVCQTKKGLTQKITFSEIVKTDPEKEGCVTESRDGKTFEFDMPVGRCVSVFCAKSGDCHRLTTLGYDEAWLREK